MTFRSARLVCLATIAVLLALSMVGSVVSSVMASPGTGWEVMSNSRPTNLPPGGKGVIEIRVFNVGAAIPSGRVTVTDTLPPGLTATNAGEMEIAREAGVEAGVGRGIVQPDKDPWECSGTRVVTCTGEPGMPRIGTVDGGGAGAGPPLDLAIAVDVAPEPGVAGTFPNVVTVAGGGALTPADSSQQVTISREQPGFGFHTWDVFYSNEDGTIDRQAGSHPYAATFAFELNTAIEENGETGNEPPGGSINTIEAELPPGLVGDPHAVPQCTRAQLNSGASGECPEASQVGFILIPFGQQELGVSVYNMVPPTGVPDEIGFQIFGIGTFLDSTVRTGGDYGITTTAKNVPQHKVEGSYLTLWGYPADHSHDFWREGSVQDGGIGGGLDGSAEVSGVAPKPFLTMPTSCSGPLTTSIRADTWQNVNVTSSISSVSHEADGNPAGMTGCEHLNFDPSLTLAPDTSFADTPAGLTAEVKPPVGGLSEVEGTSTADIQNTKVVLPAGVVINPGQAAGLQACQPGQDGLTTEAERAEGKENDGPASCPAASKVGTVSIETPLLTSRLEGGVYVLQSNPPDLKLLVTASAEGVNVKLVGDVRLDESTGQLTTTFEGTPELPFTSFKLAFSGGAQAALATPTHCGVYTSTADFGSWSSPFIADFFEENSFQIASGTNGGACPPSVLPFKPELIAGSTTDQAGGFTNFTMLLQSGDDQQRIERLQFKVPQGLLGMISRVPLCGEPQAQEGTCGAESQIGHTVVASGPGPYPLVVPQPGQPPAAIYLTGPYEGAPYGLSIVVPLHVGPFILPTQIVRAKIEVDPLTAQITVTTDPLPQVIAGVPTDLRTVNAVIDRPGFMFNPTNCDPMSFSGTAWGTPPPGTGGPGSTAEIASHFQMGSCQALTFKPNLKVSTTGKTSRKQGASLDVKLIYPAGALGHNQASSQSNIGKVKVDLPRQLPSRLTTLQKACTSQTFEANPAACPAESRVGTVSAVTPVLPVKLTGPAIFVSYGGAKFPELVFVLQGYGVTVYVHAETFISKAGITSSTLRHIPDVPIYEFELKLPQGPYSALAANGNLCKTKLAMPTAFTGQNNATLHQNTPITVTSCPKTKNTKKPNNKHAKHNKQSKKKKK